MPGVGLGLAVAERIANAFGGSISVQSQIGVGSRFEVLMRLTNPLVPTKEEFASLSSGR
jgi:signal transduction histidine kinase